MGGNGGHIMFYIVEVIGCEPNVGFVMSEEEGEIMGWTGEPIAFDTEDEANDYGKENCAWSFKVVHF
jgi:hypothetical protein